jgi:hypothetical protein
MPSNGKTAKEKPANLKNSRSTEGREKRRMKVKSKTKGPSTPQILALRESAALRMTRRRG